MQSLDKKVIKKSYEYFLQNGQLFLRPRALESDLKASKSDIEKSIKRLVVLQYIQDSPSANAGAPYELSKSGVQFAEENTKTFFQFLVTNQLIKFVWKVGVGVIIYLLGLYTEEIKTFISAFFAAK